MSLSPSGYIHHVEPSPPLESLTSFDVDEHNTGIYESGPNGWVVGLANRVAGLGSSALIGSGKGQDGGTPSVMQTVPSRVLAGNMCWGHSQRPLLEHFEPGQTASHCRSSTQPLSPGLTSIKSK